MMNKGSVPVHIKGWYNKQVTDYFKASRTTRDDKREESQQADDVSAYDINGQESGTEMTMSGQEISKQT